MQTPLQRERTGIVAGLAAWAAVVVQRCRSGGLASPGLLRIRRRPLLEIGSDAARAPAPGFRLDDCVAGVTHHYPAPALGVRFGAAYVFRDDFERVRR